jgi:hypothetical protein
MKRPPPNPLAAGIAAYNTRIAGDGPPPKPSTDGRLWTAHRDWLAEQAHPWRRLFVRSQSQAWKYQEHLDATRPTEEEKNPLPSNQLGLPLEP